MRFVAAVVQDTRHDMSFDFRLQVEVGNPCLERGRCLRPPCFHGSYSFDLFASCLQMEPDVKLSKNIPHPLCTPPLRRWNGCVILDSLSPPIFFVWSRKSRSLASGSSYSHRLSSLRPRRRATCRQKYRPCSIRSGSFKR